MAEPSGAEAQGGIDIKGMVSDIVRKSYAQERLAQARNVAEAALMLKRNEAEQQTKEAVKTLIGLSKAWIPNWSDPTGNGRSPAYTLEKAETDEAGSVALMGYVGFAPYTHRGLSYAYANLGLVFLDDEREPKHLDYGFYGDTPGGEDVRGIRVETQSTFYEVNDERPPEEQLLEAERLVFNIGRIVTAAQDETLNPRPAILVTQS